MLFSTSAQKSGTSGFYFEGDCNAPKDAVAVSESDFQTAINLPAGSTYGFDATGKLTTVAPSPALLLSAAQAAQIAIVSEACAAALIAGFTSSALGSTNTYPSLDPDQRNLLNAALAAQGQTSSWSASLWCAKSGTWTMASHTPAQVQQVNGDWMVFRQAQQKKYATLVAQIMEATSVAGVQAITW